MPMPSTGQARPWTVRAYRRKKGHRDGTEPNDRGKPGTKRHLVVNAHGTPLGRRLSGVNRNDSLMLAATLDAVTGVRTGRRGSPAGRTGQAARGQKLRSSPLSVRVQGPQHHAAHRPPRHQSDEHLGRCLWIVERTLAWLARFRRLAIRDERHADLRRAFTTLACALICRTQAKRFYI